MKFIKTFIMSVVLIAVCGFLLHSAYVEVKSRAIDQLNKQQLVMAETAARGIKSFFEHYTKLLTQLSKMEQIASFGEQGKQLMQILYLTHANEIRGITRVNSSGRIIYTFPETPGAIGTDLSSQEHIQRIMQSHEPVVSDVFDSIQGLVAIAFHVPVFEDGLFQGSLAVLIPFDQLSRNYVEPIKIGNDGYAWIISRKGVELYCPVPGHTGNSVFENCKDFPTILSMAQEMVKGNRGTTAYFFDRLRGETVESLKKQAVYFPVHLGNTFWSIVVATPEDEVLNIIQGFKDRWFLVIGLLMLISIVWTYYALRAFKILKEEEKRKQAETALKASEEKYRELVESANSIILRMDDSGKVTFFNEFAQRFFGYSEVEILGKNVLETIVPEIESTGRDLKRMIKDIAVNPDGYVNNINENVCRHGERVWVAWTNKPIMDNNGHVEEVLCIGNDITERKRAEEKLWESEERLRLTLEAINEGIWDWNIMTGDTVFSPRWYTMLGYEPYEFPQNYDSWRSLVHPDDIARTEREINDHIDSGEGYAIEIRMWTKSDGWRWILTRGMVVERDADGRPIRMVGTHSDITESKRAEQALKQAEEKFRSIFENAVEGIFQATPEGKYLSVNPALSRMCGFQSPEEMVATITDIGTQLYVNLEDRLKIKALYEEVGVVRNFEAQYKRIDGEKIWVSINARAVRDESGNMLFYEGTVEDITERTKAEEERGRLEERLQRAEKMEALGTLAGGVAHDLNNVLGVVVGYSELLLYDLDKSSSARSKAVEILKGGQRAAAIVQDLLTLARRGVPSRKVLNLNNIVLECQNSSEYAKVLSYHPNIEIKTDFESNLLNMLGSSIHLEKSLINLVSNAAEAMPDGGTLTMRTANCYLDKPISGYDEVREGDYIVLSVSDTGEGIPASDLKRIFEPFYTKKVMGRSGTGLGLAVVWGTVKDHHGYINVESEKGKGTTLTLYFPVTREEILPEQVALYAAEYIGNGESILVVDDVKEQRELASAMLKKLHYTVVSVSSGEEAVEYLKRNAVGLVVLDMIMDPGMDGLDTYTRILDIYSNQKAIIVSGFSETERVSKAQALGAGAYVKKPYVLEKLGLAIRKELDQPA